MQLHHHKSTAGIIASNLTTRSQRGRLLRIDFYVITKWHDFLSLSTLQSRLFYFHGTRIRNKGNLEQYALRQLLGTATCNAGKSTKHHWPSRIQEASRSILHAASDGAKPTKSQSSPLSVPLLLKIKTRTIAPSG